MPFAVEEFQLAWEIDGLPVKRKEWRVEYFDNSINQDSIRLRQQHIG